MSAFVWLVSGVVGGVVMATITDLLSEEMRARLDRLPQALVWVAVRRLPAHAREDMRREWVGELHEYLHGHHAVPVTRLVKGSWFALSLIWGSKKVAQGLPEADQSVTDRRDASPAPQTAAAAQVDEAHRAGWKVIDLKAPLSERDVRIHLHPPHASDFGPSDWGDGY
jgi:hypothetical protein